MSADATSSQTPQERIVNLFAFGPIGALHVRDGSIELATAAGRETIDNVQAHFDTSGGQTEGGALSGSGSFEFRREEVRFSLDSGAVTSSSTSVPVSLALTSDPGRATMKGAASFKDGFQLDGRIQTDVADARSFLRWLGVDQPEGQSLKEFSASGAMHASGATLTIDEGSFKLDGNSAVGLLAFTAGAKPRIEGTLDFERLVIDPYLGDASGEDVTASLPRQPSAQISDWILLRSLDADLRVSVDEIRVRTLSLGKGGFTITAKDGALAVEIGEIELCGGSAAGRLAVKAERTPRVSLIANLNDIALKQCLDPLGLGIPIDGVGELRADLAGEGQDLTALKHSFFGAIKIGAERGSLPVDFARLTAPVAPLESESWNSNQATQFDTLKAECRLAARVIWCRTFNMQTAQRSIFGSGDIDLGRTMLDWNLSVNRPVPSTPALDTDNAVPKLSIRGVLSQPTIRRTDRATLGEESSQANPVTSPVQ
ncbi:MAG: AsmA family protein [Methyloceanibacter sp.]|uniref:AsmA family protein n=1 Tax=Methyloceanibacter sp. TaxID=1965321 RepID=UPI003D9B1D71